MIGDSFVPLFGGFGGAINVWALLNLILSIIGIILGIVTGVRAILLHKREQDEAKNGEIFEEEEDRRRVYYKRRFIWLIITFVMAIVGIVVFILTEDIRLPMVFVDKWTIVNAIILAVEIVAVVFCFKRRKDSDDDEDDEIMNYNTHNGPTQIVSD